MKPDDDARSPGDPGELARRRRDIIKALHPDRGGDPEAFVAAMAALEQEALAGDDHVGSPGGSTAARAPGTTRRAAPGTVRFAAPVRGAATVHVTWRGRVRRVRQRAARKLLRRDNRYIDVTTHLERR